MRKQSTSTTMVAMLHRLPSCVCSAHTEFCPPYTMAHLASMFEMLCRQPIMSQSALENIRIQEVPDAVLKGFLASFATIRRRVEQDLLYPASSVPLPSRVDPHHMLDITFAGAIEVIS